ncbi:IclR family transcriptional regulator [Ketogulonicigenium vulgare]|nr:IclR family transcriptional regulator [Ketogulonicigenium vulgare]
MEPEDITSDRTRVDASEPSQGRIAPAPDAQPTEPARDTTMIQSVDRALDLLEILADAPQEMRLQDIAAAAGLKVSTCHHLLGTLTQRGYVTRGSKGKSYSLGASIHKLASGRGARFDLAREAEGYLAAMSERLGCTVLLATMDRTSLTILRQFDGGISWDASATEIATASHGTALGKAILAWLPEPEIARVVADFGLTPFTPTTIVSLIDLVESLRQIRRHGFAVEDREFKPGVLGLACALRNNAGAIIGAIGTLQPSESSSRERIRETQQELALCAREISSILR